MPKFYSAEVSDIRRETAECVSIGFGVDDRLRRMFSFKAGQFVTLRTRISGRVVQRPYSLCSGVDDPELRIAVKRIEGGSFSAFATTGLQAGQMIDLTQPEGRFFVKIDPSSSRRIVLCATGSGITPMMSIMRSVLGREARSHVTLFYGNRTRDDTMFRDDIARLVAQYPERLSVVWFLSGEVPVAGEVAGRVDESILTMIPDVVGLDGAYLCGVPGMIAALRAAFQRAGLPSERVFAESFDGGNIGQDPPPDLCVGATVRIRYEGDELMMKPGQRTVLQAALDEGLDPPYSCSSGACSSCLAKVVSGKVGMVANNVLPESDISDNWTLLCQAYAITPDVTVSCDSGW
jgi:ring-1,2-phenylacetyl-CoA epoxidase subunit PaaE